MRPHLNLRAGGAMTVPGALCLGISLAVPSNAAQSHDTTASPDAHAGVAADITPGKNRLNVLAGRRATVNVRLRLPSAAARQRQAARAR
jgi:hypothetical protein